MKGLFKALGGRNSFKTINKKMKSANHMCSGNRAPAPWGICFGKFCAQSLCATMEQSFCKSHLQTDLENTHSLLEASECCTD